MKYYYEFNTEHGKETWLTLCKYSHLQIWVYSHYFKEWIFSEHPPREIRSADYNSLAEMLWSIQLDDRITSETKNFVLGLL